MNFNITVNTGSSEEGRKRTECYKTKAQSEGLSLSAWIKLHMDKVSGFVRTYAEQPLSVRKDKP